MIWHLTKRELYDHLNSLRFAFTTVLLITLMILNAVAYLEAHKARSQAYRKKVVASLDQMRSNADNLYNLVIEGPGDLYKKPAALSFCASGGEAFIPESARGGRAGWSMSGGRFSLRGVWRMSYPQSNPNLSDVMPDSTDVDWVSIISIVLSLVAILFTFDAISAEREHGTLRLVLSNSISRGTLLVSKFFAALITISFPFLIAVLLNLFLLYTSRSISLGASEWVRLGVIVFIAFIYLSIFLALGLLISSRVNHSSTSLTILLLLWTVWIILIPSTLGSLAGGMQPPLTREAFDAQRMDPFEKLLSEDGTVLDIPILSREIPATTDTLSWAEYLREEARVNEGLEEAHVNAQIAQIQLARSVTRISPASSVRYAIESLASTGFTRHIQFLEQVRRYADEFRAFLIEADRADPESPHAVGPEEGTSQKPVRFESIPKFEDRISFRGAYIAAAMDIILLSLFFVVLFGGAFLAFLRIDV
ncbi:MAG: ABC transporter permease subunit [Candidatus Poribacteria bacterium]|nr:ABC transporter permease subunit [Candidatus Poribacteria bacterium]